LEVGTETGVDRSKSIMSYLVAYLNAGGNMSVQVRAWVGVGVGVGLRLGLVLVLVLVLG